MFKLPQPALYKKLELLKILGYDFEGNTIKPIFYAKSDLDADALGQLIQKFFITSSM